MAYLLISIILPASLIFVFSTVILELSKKLILSSNPFNLQVVLALFGRSLGVRRLYVRVLLAIFQVSLNQCLVFHYIFLSVPVCTTSSPTTCTQAPAQLYHWLRRRGDRR